MFNEVGGGGGGSRARATGRLHGRKHHGWATEVGDLVRSEEENIAWCGEGRGDVWVGCGCEHIYIDE